MTRLYLLSGALLLALLLGLWGGSAWRKGREAIANAAQLKAQRDADQKTINDLKTAAETLRQNAVDASLAYAQASARMAAIAADLETQREANRQFEQRQRAALDALAAARPDLDGLHLGADVLRHWQDSNAGRAGTPAATGATAGDAGQPAHAVPGTATPGQRHDAGADRQPRPGDRAVPRLRSTQRRAGAGGG